MKVFDQDKKTDTGDLFLRFDYEFRDKAEVLDRLKQAWIGKSKVKGDVAVRLALYAQLIAPYASPDDWFSFPRNPNRFTDLARYNGPNFRYDPLMREIEFGLKRGILKEVRAHPNSHLLPNPKQSTIRATPKLRGILAGLEVQHVLHDPIRLNEKVDIENGLPYEPGIPGRSYKRRLKRYEDTGQTRAWRDEIRKINDFLRTIRLEWLGIDQKRSGRYVHFDPNGLLTTPVYIVRIFARGSFECYGRCHGFWQGQKKWLREAIKLNGLPTCEPDYSSIHANIAYLEKGLTPPDDCYEIDGFDRDLIKRTFAILLNARDLGGAVSAITKKFEISNEEALRVIEAIKQKHSLILDQFHADAGIKMMRIDSDICVSVMLRLVEERIPFLPIHDGFRVPVPHEDRVKEIMIETFRDRYPGFICKVKS